MADEQVIETAEPGAEPAAPPTAPTDGSEVIKPDEPTEEQKKQAEEQETEQATKKPGVQKRISEIVRQREDERRRADQLEQSLQRALGVIERLQPKPEAVKPPEPAFNPTRPAPTREQFEFDEDKFVQATVAWHLEQERSKADAARRSEETQRSQREFATTVETRRTETLKQGGAKYPDFDAVVGALPAAVMNPEMAIAVLECDSAADVAYHLGKNPAEAERISKLPPIRKAIELGKLEAAIAAAAKPKPTGAPPPPNPVGGKEPATTDPDKLPMEEWYRLRQAGKIR